MDNQRFDRLARMLGANVSRRTGVLAAIGAMIGLGVADETDAARGSGRRHEKLACRNANSECTTDDQCCSNSCVPKFGGTGFRCAKAHGKKKQRNDKDKASGPIPTGDPCGPGDTCANALASCTTYTFGTPEGTYCLLPAGAACESDSWCEFDVCDHGTCAATCTVCASGCPHTTIEGAVANALPGDVITVAPGTYVVEPIGSDSYGMVSITQNLTLRACNRSEPPVIDATFSANKRFVFAIGDRSGSFQSGTCNATQPTVVFDALDFQGVATMEGRGAFVVKCHADVTMKNSAVHDFGTVYAWPPIVIQAGSHLLIDKSSIQDNGHTFSSASAVFVYLGTSDSLLEIRDSVISGNVGDFGAIFTGSSGTVHLTGATRVEYNHARLNPGAGVGMGVNGVNPGMVLTIDPSVRITQNSSDTDAGGVYAESAVTVNGATTSTIFANTATNNCPNFMQGSTCILS